ncbi:MAG: calcium-binding protein [Roseovarius sp.]
MSENFVLRDGRVVVLGTTYDGNGDLSQAIRIFRVDGSEITSAPVFFAAGTDFNDGFRSLNEPVVMEGANGGVRIVLRDNGASEGIVFELDGSGSTLSSSTFTIDNQDPATPYVAVYDPYVHASNGDIFSSAYQDLYRSDGNGTYIGITDRPGPFESVSDAVMLQVGNRVLRISQVYNGTNQEVELRGQFYALNGAVSGSEFLVADDLDFVTGQWGVEAAVLTDGRIAVAYTSGRTGDEDDSASTVFMTVLNPNGTVAIPEQIVNTGDTSGTQDVDGVFALQGGGWAVVYNSTGAGFGTADDAVRVRFYDSDGVKYEDYVLNGNVTARGDNFHVSSTGVVTEFGLVNPGRLYDAGGPDDPGLTGDEQILSQGTVGEFAEDPDAATLADGRVVYVYDRGNLEGFVRIYDPADGGIIDVGSPVTGAGDMQVAALEDGGFVVAWIDNGVRGDLQVRVHNADGSVRTPAQTILTGEAEHIDVMTTGTGFALHWVDDTGTLDDDGYLQFFDAQGAALTTAAEYHQGLDQDENVEGITLSDGRLAMVWRSQSETSVAYSTHYRIYNADGTPATGIRDFPQPNAGVGEVMGGIGTDDGGFIVVYAGTATTFGTELRMTVFDANGNSSISDRHILLDDTALNYRDVDLEMNGDGQLVIAYFGWTDGTTRDDVRFSIYETNGTEVLANRIASENVLDEQDSPVLVSLLNGDTFMLFEDDTNILGSSQNSIRGVTIQGGTFPVPEPTPGPDILNGTDGDDSIDLLAGNDVYSGGDGDDFVFGNDGEDSISGDNGNDTLMGGADNDTLRGGAGDDVLDGGGGGDVLDGGDGYDIASYASATRSVRVDLQNPAISYNDGFGDTFISIEEFRTGDGIDQLRGDENDNIFRTGGVSDRLYGRGGDDMLFGEAGADAFYGGLGADTMTGGADAGRSDRYIYFNAAETGVNMGNRDVITDFVSGEDRIEIRRIDADITQGFKQFFDFIGDAAFSGTAGELRFQQAGGITLVQADRDGDGAADMEIELTGTIDLVADDFLI